MLTPCLALPVSPYFPWKRLKLRSWNVFSRFDERMSSFFSCLSTFCFFIRFLTRVLNVSLALGFSPSVAHSCLGSFTFSGGPPVSLFHPSWLEVAADSLGNQNQWTLQREGSRAEWSAAGAPKGALGDHMVHSLFLGWWTFPVCCRTLAASPCSGLLLTYGTWQSRVCNKSSFLCAALQVPPLSDT